MLFPRAIVFVLMFAVLLVSGAPGQSPADYPQVDTRVEPTSGTVGDKFSLQITVTVPDLVSLQVMPLFDTQTTWTAVGTPESKDSGKSGVQTRTLTYTIVPFETGRQDVPQVAFTYSPADGTSNTVLSEAHWVQIDSVLSGDGSASALRDVKPPVALPLPKMLVWSGGLILAALLALLGWWLWRRYSQRVKKFLGKGLTPPEVALKKIASLENDRLIEQKKMKELYTRLTDVVRDYLSQAYGIHAMDLTSNELMDEMDRRAEEESPLHLENFRKAMARLVEVMNEGDLVKFARFIPEASQCRRSIQAARDVINFTRYRFEADKEEPDARKARESGGGKSGGKGMSTPAGMTRIPQESSAVSSASADAEGLR